MKKDKSDKKKREKTWEWSNRNINIGNGWTLLAVECYLRHSCNGCIYARYCKQKKGTQIPILRRVIRGLFAKYGEPPQNLLDKAKQIGYDTVQW